MPGNFFPMIARMKYITRWGLMRNTQAENIQEHSHQVAVLAHALAVIENKYFDGKLDPGQVAVAALYHDAGEILTGDLPTPIKYDNPEIQTAYKAIEAAAENKLLSMLPEDLRPDFTDAVTIPDPAVRAVVKAADRLSAYLKCVEELKSGNSEFRKAKEQTYQALLDTESKSLRYFMEHFLEGFELTLDELS